MAAAGSTAATGLMTATPSSGGSGQTLGTGSMASGATGAASGAPNAGSGNNVSGSMGATSGENPGTDPPAPKPLMVDPNDMQNYPISFSAIQLDPQAGKSSANTFAGEAQQLQLKPSAKIQGKLIIALGGIGGGPGGGGFEAYAVPAGFHVFDVATQTAVSSAPDMYKQIIATDPMNADANRQVGDARMEAFDGVDRVDWLQVLPPDSIVNRTEHALAYGQMIDPGGDWGYFLNADGSVRWTDVYIVGYSFGAQTGAMISKYVRFGRVVSLSGPEAEGFPNATWITQPSATPVDRLYTMLGFIDPYPSTNTVDAAPNDVMSMVTTVTSAGWINPPGPVNVVPGSMGPFMDTHILAMVGSNPHSPGGHTVFCTNDPMNGWLAACQYAFGTQ